MYVVPMYITGLQVHGLRGAEAFEAESLGRLVTLPDGPRGVAIADAISLFAAALSEGNARAAIAALGLADPPDSADVLVEDGFPTQVSLPRARGVRALLADDVSRQVRISAEMELDPPLFGRLRAQAARDPRLVTALGAGARVTVKVGWLFTNDRTVGSVGVLGFSVGDTAFPTSGSERPTWMSDVLRDLAGRFGRVGSAEPLERVVRRLFDASLSPDPALRGRFLRASAATEAPPFYLGALALVRDGDALEAAFGPSLRRTRAYGPFADEATRTVEAVFVQGPDVLVVEAPGREGPARDEWIAWVGGRATDADATLEQVFVVPGGPDVPKPEVA